MPHNRVYNDEYYKGLTLSNNSVNVLSEYLFVCRGPIVVVNFFFLVLCFIVNHLATTLMIFCFSGDESHVVDTERLSHELKCAIENENIR